MEELNEENKKKKSEISSIKSALFWQFIHPPHSVIRLLLLTAISSMLLIAEILLSLIHRL